jgi:hypothetical protein
MVDVPHLCSVAKLNLPSEMKCNKMKDCILRKKAFVKTLKS